MDTLPVELKREILTECARINLQTLLTLRQISSAFYTIYTTDSQHLIQLALESTGITEADYNHALALTEFSPLLNGVHEAAVTETLRRFQAPHAEGFKAPATPKQKLQAIARFELVRKLGSCALDKSEIFFDDDDSSTTIAFMLVFTILACGPIHESDRDLIVVFDEASDLENAEANRRAKIMCRNVFETFNRALDSLPRDRGQKSLPEHVSERVLENMDWRVLASLQIAAWNGEDEAASEILQNWIERNHGSWIYGKGLLEERAVLAESETRRGHIWKRIRRRFKARF